MQGHGTGDMRPSSDLENHKSCARGVRLGATLGATRMNNLRMIRTRLDNRERRARGHEPI
jgi:hypothetical protein